MLGVTNPNNFPSCEYVWVMNHWELFSAMLLNYFGFFGLIYGKRDEIIKSGKFRGPTPWRRDPTQQRKSMPKHGREGGLDKPWVR